MAAIPIRIIVGILLVMTLGHSSVPAQPAQPSDVETPGTGCDREQSAPSGTLIGGTRSRNPSSTDPCTGSRNRNGTDPRNAG
jgi:hypothetical protein